MLGFCFSFGTGLPTALFSILRFIGTSPGRCAEGHPTLLGRVTDLARIIHEASTAEADSGMSTALRSVGLLDVLSSTPAGPSVARLVSMPVCAASLRTFMNNAG